jgi:hypothetical protein
VTDVSDAVQDDVAAPDERTDDKAGPLAARPVRRLRGTVLLAFLATVVAVVASALLPFAPVTVNKPTVSRPRDRPHRRCQRHGGSDVETAAFDRHCRHAGFDQRDPLAFHDLMVGRRRDRHGPAEMIGDAHAHASEHALADTNL